MRIINMMEADIRVSMYYKCHSWRKTRSSLGLLVVLLAVPLVSEELGVHALGARVLLLLLLLDSVPMVLVRLVVSRVVLGLRHGACLTQVCGERESKGARGVREDGRRKGNNTLIPRKRDAKRGEGGPPEPSGTETRDASRRTEDPRREERERRAARDGRSAPRAASPPPSEKKEGRVPPCRERPRPRPPFRILSPVVPARESSLAALPVASPRHPVRVLLFVVVTYHLLLWTSSLCRSLWAPGSFSEPWRRLDFTPRKRVLFRV